MKDVLVKWSVEDGVGRLTLNRPQAMNAVTPDFVADLKAATSQVDASGARCLLIDAAGPNFCVGADLKHLAANTERLPDVLGTMADGFHAALEDLAALSIPVVAAVQGHAVGAGFGLALIADILIIADNAVFSTGYARLGLSADAGVSWSLTRAVGLRKARALLLTATPIPASEMQALGLAEKIVPILNLAEIATKQARALASGFPEAFTDIKRLTSESEATPFVEHLMNERRSVVTLASGMPAQTAIGGLLRKSGA